MLNTRTIHTAAKAEVKKAIALMLENHCLTIVGVKLMSGWNSKPDETKNKTLRFALNYGQKKEALRGFRAALPVGYQIKETPYYVLLVKS